MSNSREANMWLSKFNRDAGFKSAVLLSGNTNDIILNQTNGKYDNILNVVVDSLRKKGYSNVIVWDRIDGINDKISDKINVEDNTSNNATSNTYDFD